MDSSYRVWAAGPQDAAVAARLLADFNTEFDEPTPPPDVLAGRLVRAMAHDASVLFGSLGGDDPQAIAVLRFRPALWVERLECYLAELYVVPAERGKGLGRAVVNQVLDHARERGAGYIDIERRRAGHRRSRAVRERGLQQHRRPPGRADQLLLRTRALTPLNRPALGRCRRGRR